MKEGLNPLKFHTDILYITKKYRFLPEEKIVNVALTLFKEPNLNF